MNTIWSLVLWDLAPFSFKTILLTLDCITTLHTLFSTARGKQTDSNCKDRKHICQLTLILAASRHILKCMLQQHGKRECTSQASLLRQLGEEKIKKIHFSRTVLK